MLMLPARGVRYQNVGAKRDHGFTSKAAGAWAGLKGPQSGQAERGLETQVQGWGQHSLVHAWACPVVCSFRLQLRENCGGHRGQPAGAHAERMGPGKNKRGQSEAKRSVRIIQYITRRGRGWCRCFSQNESSRKLCVVVAARAGCSSLILEPPSAGPSHRPAPAGPRMPLPSHCLQVCVPPPWQRLQRLLFILQHAVQVCEQCEQQAQGPGACDISRSRVPPPPAQRTPQQAASAHQSLSFILASFTPSMTFSLPAAEAGGGSRRQVSSRCHAAVRRSLPTLCTMQQQVQASWQRRQLAAPAWRIWFIRTFSGCMMPAPCTHEQRGRGRRVREGVEEPGRL